MRKRILFELRRLPVEALGVAALGIFALEARSWWRWAALAAAVPFTLALLRTGPGTKLFAAIVATSFFAAAVFWEDGGGWRAVLAGLGVLSIWIAGSLGAVVWPDVAIIFVIGLAVVAIRNAHDGKPPEPAAEPAVAVFDLPAARVRPPANALPAASEVELLALTPKGTDESNVVTHDASPFDVLLLTPVKTSRPAGPVRILLERGRDGATARSLARAIVDASEFVLVPRSECFIAPARPALTHRRAMAVLRAHGIQEATAKEYADSFAGPIDFVPVSPGDEFNRYYSGGSTVGRFLTDTEFRTSADAQDGLELPESNKATHIQSVRVIAPAMTLRGRIRGGLKRALQFFVLRPACFDYGAGDPVEGGAP